MFAERDRPAPFFNLLKFKKMSSEKKQPKTGFVVLTPDKYYSKKLSKDVTVFKGKVEFEGHTLIFQLDPNVQKADKTKEGDKDKLFLNISAFEKTGGVIS